jgi:hypothetical protein
MQVYRDALVEIVQADPPMTGRQVFYQMVSRGLVDKTYVEANLVNRALCDLRRAGELDWDDIVDNTRSVQRRPQWDSVGDRITGLSKYYHRDFWQDRDDCPAIWIEKDALAGVFSEITDIYGVPLMPARGDASDSFIYECSQYLTDESTVYVFTDLDGKGEGSIFTKIAEKLEEHFDLTPTVKRVALTPAQVRQYHLPKRPPKLGDLRNYAVELDALPKAILQQLVTDCIRNHVDDNEWQEHLKQEETDVSRLAGIAKRELKKQ